MAVHVRHACTGSVAAASACRKAGQNMPVTVLYCYFKTNYARPPILEPHRGGCYPLDRPLASDWRDHRQATRLACYLDDF